MRTRLARRAGFIGSTQSESPPKDVLCFPEGPSSERRRTRVLRIIARMNLGGPAHHVSLLSGHLDQSRYETILVAGRVGPGERSAVDLAGRHGSSVVMISSLGPELRPLADLRALGQVIRVIRRFRPDIVHTHTAKAGALGRLAAVLAARPSPVVVHTYHGHVLEGYFGRLKSAVYRSLETTMARASDSLLAVSQATVDDLVRLNVAPRSKFRMVPLGLDLKPFLEVAEEEGSRFREELGVAPEEVLVSVVGRLAPIKRIDLALRAVARARDLGSPLRLAVVGDGVLRSELERLARELGVDRAVSFVGYRRDTAEIAAATDIALLTSENEGTPVSLIEAAAASRPAVATAVGGVPEMMGDGCGLTVASGDVPALADALVELAEDPDRRARMGSRARCFVRSRFSVERLVSDIDGHYQSLLRVGTSQPNLQK